VWLVRLEREIRPLVEMYKMLLRELTKAGPPLVLVVNSFANFDCQFDEYIKDAEENDDKAEVNRLKTAREQAKDKVREEAYQFGRSVAEAAGIHALKVLAGAEMRDLETRIKVELVQTLLGTSAKASCLKTFGQLQSDYQNCKSDKEAAARDLKEQKAQLKKLQETRPSTSSGAISSAMEPVSIAVIGAPGHGKSSFLNGLSGRRDAFETAAGGESCTKEVSEKQFSLKAGEAELILTLVDTMGFPDPAPQKAVEFYDAVVTACNQPLNAIVWLVRLEREIRPLVEMYNVLLREFTKAGPPFVLVVNSFQSFGEFDDDIQDAEEKEDKDAVNRLKTERQEAKSKVREESFQFGRSVAEAAGIQALKVLAGAEMRDLKTSIKQELAQTLLGTSAKTSCLKTFGQLQAEYENCKSDEEAAARDVQERKAQLQKLQENLCTYSKTQEERNNHKDETHQVYYRDWYKLWMGGHHKTEYRLSEQERLQLDVEMAQCETKMVLLKKDIESSQGSEAERQAAYEESVNRTRKAQAAFILLQSQLVGSASTP